MMCSDDEIALQMTYTCIFGIKFQFTVCLGKLFKAHSIKCSCFQFYYIRNVECPIKVNS